MPEIDPTLYPVQVRRLPAADGGLWIAEVPDLPGCLSDGRTQDEAFTNVRGALDSWIEAARELGREVPPPSGSETYSGQWRVRTPKSLHRRLAERAKAEGVSLNTLAVTLMAEGLGRRDAVNDGGA
jgi:antitoxin HicB